MAGKGIKGCTSAKGGVGCPGTKGWLGCAAGPVCPDCPLSGTPSKFNSADSTLSGGTIYTPTKITSDAAWPGTCECTWSIPVFVTGGVTYLMATSTTTAFRWPIRSCIMDDWGNNAVDENGNAISVIGYYENIETRVYCLITRPNRNVGDACCWEFSIAYIVRQCYRRKTIDNNNVDRVTDGSQDGLGRTIWTPGTEWSYNCCEITEVTVPMVIDIRFYEYEGGPELPIESTSDEVGYTKVLVFPGTCAGGSQNPPFGVGGIGIGVNPTALGYAYLSNPGNTGFFGHTGYKSPIGYTETFRFFASLEWSGGLENYTGDISLTLCPSLP